MARWTTSLEGGPRRVNHAAVAIQEHIFTFGGYCTGEDYEVTRPMDVHILNTVTLRWRLVPFPPQGHADCECIPYQRYGHSAVAHKDCAYIWGGRNDMDGACNILFCFSSSSWSWSKPAVEGRPPNARDGHTACVVDNKMYIFGGYEDFIDRFSNDLHMLDFKTMTWSQVQCSGKSPTWRDFHSATAVGRYMVVWGGRCDEGGDIYTNQEVYEDSVHFYDTVTRHWGSPTTFNQPSGRRSHSAFVWRNGLYVFGGYNGLFDQHYADLYKLDLDTLQWSKMQPGGRGPCARRRQCCCVIGDQVFLFGGTSPRNTGFSSGQESDLMDHSDLHILDFSPSLKTLCKLTVLENKLDTSCLPDIIRWELNIMTTNNSITRSCNNNG